MLPEQALEGGGSDSAAAAVLHALAENAEKTSKSNSGPRAVDAVHLMRCAVVAQSRREKIAQNWSRF